MNLFGIPKASYLRNVFFFTHLTGFLLGALFSVVAKPLCGAEITVSFTAACLLFGYLMGAISYLYVRNTLKKQLRQQIDVLRVLGGWDEEADEGSLESMMFAVEASVAQVEDLIKTVLVTVDTLLPHYQNMTEGVYFLSERARAGLSAAEESQAIISDMEQRFRQVMEKTSQLAEHTQDEAALSRELAASLEEMAEAMDVSTAKFLETTSTVEEMAASIREVAYQAIEVGRSVESVSQDLDTIGETFERIREEADNGVKASQAVREDAELGLTAAKNSMTEMEKIEDESRKASRAMDQLSIHTQEVETVIEVIRELVSDTELLAFNAAIIAAQAGDEGKGFSVVADEIRDLADRTSTSAGEIHTTIQTIGLETRKVLSAVTATAERIDEGKHAFESAENALRKIAKSAKKSADCNFEISRLTDKEGGRARNQLDEAGHTLRAVQQIARAMKEQEEGVFRIQSGVEEMKAAADRVAKGMEEQVRANQSFNRGLEERDSQIQDVAGTMQFLLGITHKVVGHFGVSTDRLHGNVSKVQSLSAEIKTLEGSTTRLRKLVEGLSRQVEARPTPDDVSAGS